MQINQTLFSKKLQQEWLIKLWKELKKKVRISANFQNKLWILDVGFENRVIVRFLISSHIVTKSLIPAAIGVWPRPQLVKKVLGHQHFLIARRKLRMEKWINYSQTVCSSIFKSAAIYCITEEDVHTLAVNRIIR